MGKPEVWLRGPIEAVPPLLQPVAHSLLQCREELERVLPSLAPEQLWHAPNGAASAGYHALHAAASLDRLFTYARGATLSDAQLTVLQQESARDHDLSAEELLAAFDAVVERALEQLRTTEERMLTETRLVGRGKIPSTVIGLLFHAAEHTQRHAGQLATTAKIVIGGSEVAAGAAGPSA